MEEREFKIYIFSLVMMWSSNKLLVISNVSDYNIDAELQHQILKGFTRLYLADNHRDFPFTVSNEPAHGKTNKMACASSEDSDQSGHPPSLIRVFAGRSVGS